jgi:hypothetical protein
MTILNVGVSHRSAAAEVLEKLTVPPEQRGSVLARLRAVPSVDEVAVLSTCNRVEIYAAAHGPAGPVARAVADVLAVHGRVAAGQVWRLARVRIGGAAIEHLFTVACGLDSMAVGEDQIVAQIKDAALRASKRARTQTTISTEGISLARAGLDFAAAHLGGLVALGRHLAGRAMPSQIPQVRAIVAAEAAAYTTRQDQTIAAPVIAAMHAQIRQLADAELARLHDRLPDLTDQRAETAATVHRIVRKVLHQPTIRAKQFSAAPLHPSLLMPAPAQGVLAVECRTDDPVTAAQLRTLDHPSTRAVATAERAFLAALGAGCGTPVGALAELTTEPVIRLSGVIAAPDGSSVIRAQMTGAASDGDALGRRLAQRLLQHGGAALLYRSQSSVLIATTNGGT